jgi:hypothetical protein
MATELTKTIIDCTTGETTIVPLSAEEIADRQILIEESLSNDEA